MYPKLYIPTPLEHMLENISHDIDKLGELDTHSIYHITSNDLLQHPTYYINELHDIPYIIEFYIFNALLNSNYKYRYASITQRMDGSDESYFYNTRYGKPFKDTRGRFTEYMNIAYDIYRVDELVKSL